MASSAERARTTASRRSAVRRSRRRCAIVTGAGGSIGRGIAQAFAADGYAVLLADLPRASGMSRAEPVASALQRRGYRVEALAVDIALVAETKRLASTALERYGRVDVLVNVAGVTSRGYADDIDEAEWDRVLGVNLKGTFFCCQAVIPAMRKQRWGRIINVGSVNAKTGGAARPYLDRNEQANAANVAYSASKGGVHTLTIALAKELAGDGITVNAVAPGTIESAMTRTLPAAVKRLIPVGRIGRAADVAAAVSFLASESAAFITGEILDVNGGVLMD